MNPNMNPQQMNQGYGGQPNNMAPQMMANHSQSKSFLFVSHLKNRIQCQEDSR